MFLKKRLDFKSPSTFDPVRGFLVQNYCITKTHRKTCYLNWSTNSCLSSDIHNNTCFKTIFEQICKNSTIFSNVCFFSTKKYICPVKTNNVLPSPRHPKDPHLPWHMAMPSPSVSRHRVSYLDIPSPNQPAMQSMKVPSWRSTAARLNGRTSNKKKNFFGVYRGSYCPVLLGL